MAGYEASESCSSVRRGLAPGEHAADSGYASAELLLAARARGITLLAPLLPDPSPQARSGGYTADMFTIDWEAKQVTCPQGQVSSSWTPARRGAAARAETAAWSGTAL